MANNKNEKRRKNAARFLAFILALIFVGSAATYLLILLTN